MNGDWFTQDKADLFTEIVDSTGVSDEDARKVYGFLNDIGLIDYDIEKEVLYDRYVDEDED